MKKCWKCAEEIQDAAIACRYCGADQPLATPSPSPERPVLKKQRPFPKGQWLAIGGGLAFLFIIGASLNPKPVLEAKGDTVPVAEVDEVAERQASDRAKGFHCLSAWDGSHAELVKQIKAGLRNPSSFEHDATEVGPLLRTNNRPIKMVYRAENGFGGMNVETVWGALDQDTCTVTVIADPSQIDKLLPTE